MRRAHCDRSLETVQGLRKWRGWYTRAACCGVKLGAKRPPRYRVYTQRRHSGQTCRVFMYSDQFLFLLCCSAVDSTITVCSSTIGCDSGILTSSPVVHRLCRCRCNCNQGRSCPLRHLLARGCHKPAEAPNPNNKFSSSLNSTPSVSLDNMSSFRHGKFTAFAVLSPVQTIAERLTIAHVLTHSPGGYVRGLTKNWRREGIARFHRQMVSY
jgi:hypothetical protein